MKDNRFSLFSERFISDNRDMIDINIYNLQKAALDQIIEFDNEIIKSIDETVVLQNQFVNKYNYDQNLSTISCAIIVKDEETFIERCIMSIIDYCDEVIIVDTGSRDRTIDIIKKISSNKIKIYYSEWKEDFSYSRNEALKKVSSEWVFFIDADEYIDEKSIPPMTFRELLGAMRNLPCISQTVLCPQIEDTKTKDVKIETKRIFRFSSDICYYGLVHEEPRFNNNDMNTISIKMLIKHDGYADDIVIKKDKIKRNMKLLRKMRDSERNNKKWLYYYLRDGFTMLDKEEILFLLLSNTKINPEQRLSIKNLQIHEYSFSFLDMLAVICMSEKNDDLFKDSIECMDYINQNNSNTIYYSVLYRMIEIKSEINKLLKSVLDYRTSNFKPEYGSINSNGSHIDFLLGILLFETGHFASAFKYFELSKETFNIPHILEIYEKVKEVNWDEKI